MNELAPIIGVALSVAVGYVSLLFKRNRSVFGELTTELNRYRHNLEDRQRDLQRLNERIDRIHDELLLYRRWYEQSEVRSRLTPESTRTQVPRESSSQKCDSEPERSGRTRFERV